MNAVLLRSFFMPKFRHKEEFTMFNDEVIEKIFSHKEMQTIPIGAQSTAVAAIGEVLESIKEERPYVTVSELFSYE